MKAHGFALMRKQQIARRQPGGAYYELLFKNRALLIGSGCWLGAHSIILKDVELGDGCVVGVGSVVTRSAPAGKGLSLALHILRCS